MNTYNGENMVPHFPMDKSWKAHWSRGTTTVYKRVEGPIQNVEEGQLENWWLILDTIRTSEPGDLESISKVQE
jgi:hypothetical protein